MMIKRIIMIKGYYDQEVIIMNYDDQGVIIMNEL